MTSTASATVPALEALNLTKVYGSGNTEVVAMKDVTLRIARGEVVALLGPSGAGKSTLLTALGLINPPTSGRLLIGGAAVLEADRAFVDLRAFRRQHLTRISHEKCGLMARPPLKTRQFVPGLVTWRQHSGLVPQRG